MNKRVFVAVVGLGLCSVAAAQPPLEAFAALPAMQSPSLSPDGQRIAFIAHVDKGSFVYASRLASQQADAVVDVNSVKARKLSFANNDTVLLLASETETVMFAARMTEALAPYGIDLSGELNVRQLIRGGGVRAIGGGLGVRENRLIGYERSTGRVLFPLFEGDGDRVLYSVDAKSDLKWKVDDGPRFTRDWVVDENAVPRYRVEYTEKNDNFRIYRKEDRWELFVALTLDIPELDVLGLDRNGELVVGVRPADGGRYGLYVVTPNGSLGRALYKHDARDVSDVRIDPYTNFVVGAHVDGESPVWFDAGLTKQQAALDETFRGEQPRIVSWSEDRSKFIVSTTPVDRAPAFYLYDAKALTASQIGSAYPALDRNGLAPRVPYTYKARDGVDIPGYLTRPLGVNGAAPLVLLPHSGPASHDVEGFDWLAHFLASRGYVVLQPNFRGSDGYGRAWEDAGHGGWGLGVMQHDLSDGVAALVAAGIADPKRVCIVGAGYGGYAALAGAAFTPELYRCAVSYGGVSDLRDMVTLQSGRRDYRSSAVSYMEESLGIESANRSRAQLDAASPAHHADRVQAAVLLIHGRDDSVVVIGQSKKMEKALRDAGKTVKFVELEGEDHWLSLAPTRLEALKAIDSFLAEQLGGPK
ncbi:MAG TPA: prolyl oligopeptidase family serine peptidase [Gammaproteobacteria bacterium]|nr:prolyl oligopeptidase family serine peptidase [Gammaproteobacteria bacterium]